MRGAAPRRLRERTILDTVRQLGFLQIDPISTVAPPQQLVLWSRLGPYDRTELDRLLWDEKKLVEWNAYIWPIESLPLLKARMRRRRRDTYAWERRGSEFLKTNKRFKAFVLRELDENGPMLSREIEGDAVRTWQSHRWYGNRSVAVMLELLHGRGVVAIVGRRNGQRLWDLAERWYPETETVSLREADRALADRRFRALGVRLTPAGWEAHPEAEDGPVGDRVTFLSPFDRLIHDRDRAESLFDFHYRLEMYVPEGQARVRLLRASDPRGRPPRRPCRAALRSEDPDLSTCSVPGATPREPTRRSRASLRFSAPRSSL